MGIVLNGAVRAAVSRRSGGLVRTLLTALGVGIGVALALLALTAVPALAGRDQRGAWQSTSPTPGSAGSGTGLHWLAFDDQYLSRDVFVLRVAPAGGDHPALPGVDAIPSAGETLLSPALAALIRSLTADALGDRFPGRVVGEVGSAGLSFPDQYVVIIGEDPAALSGVDTVQSLATEAHGILGSSTFTIILTVAGIGILVPVASFVGAAARVSAARREQRFAALRLLGATRGQVARMAGAETLVAAIPGAALGWFGYLILREPIAQTITFDGAHFFPEDVAAPPLAQAVVLIAAPVACAVAVVIAVRRAGIDPVAARRSQTRPAPRAWRLLPLAAGLVGLAVIAVTPVAQARASGTTVVALALGSTVAALVGGFVLAGPLVCRWVARGIGVASRRLPGLIAARRVAADPHAFFRAVGGVGLAALVATMFAGSATALRTGAADGHPGELRPAAVEVVPPRGADSDALIDTLNRDGAVTAVVLTRETAQPGSVGVACDDLRIVMAITCPAGPSPADRLPAGVAGHARLETPDATMPVHAIYALTDGAPLSVERVRTLALIGIPGSTVDTGLDLVELDHRQIAELGNGLRLALLFVLVLAAAGLTVGVAGSLVERRLPFAILRATGMKADELRRVVLWETAAPLLVTAGAGILVGLAASAAMSVSAGQPWNGPGPEFVLVLAVGAALVLAIAALALPLVGRLTATDTVRFE